MSNLQYSIIAEQSAAHCRGSAVTVDKATAFRAPSSLLLKFLKAPLNWHRITAGRQVAQGHPDRIGVVPHATTIF